MYNLGQIILSSLGISFSICETRVIVIITYFLESLCRLNELLHEKPIVQGLAHLNEHYKNIRYYFSYESTLQVQGFQTWKHPTADLGIISAWSRAHPGF